MKKLVLFGAGKIGRSFIGQLFSRGGYEVVFIDMNTSLIDALNRKRSYTLVIKSDDGNQNITITNVRGLYLSQTEEIKKEIVSANLVATAVGPANLPPVIELFAESVKLKLESESNSPTDIIFAENLRNASGYAKEKLSYHFSDGEINTYFGLIETSIGKMVPIMTEEDISEDELQIFAEPYNSLILDKKGFKNELPDIDDIFPKENMNAWVDRKSFIHNLGHATAAYFGHYKHPEYIFIHEVLASPEVFDFTRKTMLQAGRALRLRYPGEFSEDDIIDHIDDLLKRFSNKSLGDTVFRVGMDLPRKLGPDDRILGAINMAMEVGASYDLILKTLIYGMHFNAVDENGHLFAVDKWVNDNFNTLGIHWVITNICKLDPKYDASLIQSIVELNNSIK